MNINQCIIEYSSSSQRRGLGFLKGKLVRYDNDKINPVSLRESVLIFRRLERLYGENTLPDGTHVPASRAKWLAMLARAIPGAN